MRLLPILLLSLLLSLSAVSQDAWFDWVTQCGNPPNTTDTKTTITTADDGTFYLAGEFTDTAVFGDNTIISDGGTDIFLVRHDALGDPLWTLKIGGADYDYVQKVKVSPEGNVLLAGYFYGSTMIGNDPYTSYGSQDVYIALFKSDGDFLWSRRAGGIMADYIATADVDEDNNIVIAGYFYGEMDFGDTVVNASASSDIYLAKYDSQGNLIWVTTAGGSSSDQVKSVSFDPDGNLLFTASYYYDFTIADSTLTTADPVGLVIGELNPDGELLRVFQLQGTYLSPDVFIKADHSGSFYISGNFSEEIYFGTNTFIAGPFNQDVFVAKYNSNGVFLWAGQGYSLSSDEIIGIDVDIYNNLYITGHYLDHIHFGQLTLTYTLCCGSREVFVVNYSSDGKELWGKQISGARASAQSVSMNNEGAIMISGMFADTVDFDELTLISPSGYKNYITCLMTEMFTGVPGTDANPSFFHIFPNPSRDWISIQPEAINRNEKYYIYNSEGILVADGILSRQNPVDISFLDPGVYFIMAKERPAAKFIKQ